MSLQNILSCIQTKKTAKTSRLIAVSKLQPVEKIRNLAAEGQKIFAESYVQEALPKITELKDLHLEWHFIGHLQKNKAKLVVGAFDLIHSVDSLELAETINRLAGGKGLTQRILLQLNLAGEETKGGFSRSEFEKSIPALGNLKNLRIEGLMTMPPLFEDPQMARPFFRELKEIQIKTEKKYSQQLPDIQELSMGTSADFEIALEEGATLIRLGTILFGERPKR